MIAQNQYDIPQRNLHDQVKIKKSKHFHDHRLSPLTKQNPYSNFILSIKTTSVHRFSKCLQVLLGQTKIKILTRK